MIHTNALGLSNDFSVQVLTTKDRGFTPEEIAERAADKIVSVSDNATPEVRAQAEAFKQKIVINQDGKEIKSIALLRLIYSNFKVFSKDGYDDFFMVREYIDDDGDCQHSPEIEVYIDRIDNVDDDDIKVLKRWGFA